MTKIAEQLNKLKESIENIRKNMDVLKLENTLLQKQQQDLVAQKAMLIKKNETAKNEIQSILDRIKNIEIG